MEEEDFQKMEQGIQSLYDPPLLSPSNLSSDTPSFHDDVGCLGLSTSTPIKCASSSKVIEEHPATSLVRYDKNLSTINSHSSLIRCNKPTSTSKPSEIMQS